MNERIKELEDQCWEDVPVDIDYDYLSRVRRVFNREKFAELIVRECVGLCSQERENYRCLGSDYCHNMADGLEEAAELIKEHFGVEE